MNWLKEESEERFAALAFSLDKVKKGFSLVETLVMLVVMASVAALLIPVVMSSQAEARRMATLKHVVLMLAEIQDEGVTSGELSNSNFQPYFLERLNYVERCDGDSTVGRRCWDRGVQGNYGEAREPGVILPGGVRVVGFNNRVSPVAINAIIVDWNGTQPPNQVGDDQLSLSMCYQETPCILGTHVQDPNTIMPYSGSVPGSRQAANSALYFSLFE